jgi:hypothetical protein
MAVTSVAETSARSVLACFNKTNLTSLGTLSPQSSDVKDAFESGSCLALASGAEARGLERSDGAWRFHLGDNAKWLYAPDWAAGFSSVDAGYDADRVQTYAGYIPVSATLIERGRGLAACRTEIESLDAESDVFDKQWAEYWDSLPSSRSPSGMRQVVYLGEKGQRLRAQRESLGIKWNELSARCDQYEAMSIDRGFAEYLFGGSVDS